MEEDWRILDLSLEIIHLLTGEMYVVEKNTNLLTPSSSRHGPFPIIVSPQYSLIPYCVTPEMNKRKKVWEVTKKMMELLKGEVPVRCQDVAAYFSMEEWQFIEAHKDLYKDSMIGNEETFRYGKMAKNTLNLKELLLNLSLEIIITLAGQNCAVIKMSSDERNTVQRSLRLSSRLKKKHNLITSPPSLLPEGHNEQEIMEVTMKMMKLLAGEVPIRCQDIAIYFSMEEWQYIEEHKDLYKDTMMENQESLTSPAGRQDVGKTSEGHPIPHPDVTAQDDGVTHHSPGVRPCTGHSHHRGYSFDRSLDGPCHKENRSPSNPDRSFSDSSVSATPGEVEGFISKSVLPLRQKKQPQLGSFSCSECTRRFKSKLSLVMHKRVHEREQGFSCAECGKFFKQKFLLSYHQRSHIVEKTFRCSECGKCFKYKCHLNRHFKVHLDKNQFSCPECEKSFYRKDLLDRHFHKHTGEMPYTCSECGKCFQDKTALVKHYQKHCQQTQMACTCTECGERFKKDDDFLIHQVGHARPFSCSQGPKRLTKRVHINEGALSHTCTKCGKSFKRKGSLCRHQQLHTGEARYTCGECGKAYTEKGSFVKHQRSHTGEMPYTCRECGKAYTEKGSLVRHQRSHTGETPYTCGECGKGYTEKNSFIKHKLTHTSKTPYSCPECGIGFKMKGDLWSHRRSHLGDRPFSCSECGKCFKEKAGLSQHQRNHTGIMPYMCTECGKCFSRKFSLTKHYKKHTGEQPFSCPCCGKRFKHKVSLVAHCRRHVAHNSRREDETGA
ncbi:oocyte zinc finger protein XlCOF6-like [Hyperolius riggenbachi]|uniref:oocyte zinc finger protein XlCOF6-like n=1 Tax=Hyperolius riggenbachi TaxID=752182 RepID=UPI0035A3CAD9